jgi:hypothetical protein
MTASKALPARPSLESLRKQAKKLVRDVAAGDGDAVRRARAHLPHIDLPLTQRNAQLVIAREYGFAGWQDLTGEVEKRLGRGLDWAVAQAARIIHDNDVEGLKQLVTEYPALLSWHGDSFGERGGLLGFATDSYGDSFDPVSEQHFTRAACAELLIEAGAIATPSVIDNLTRARARGLLMLFQRKGLLPPTLKFSAALGDMDAVRTGLEQQGDDPAVVNEAFTIACDFQHEPIALLLLDRCIAIDPELGAAIDRSVGRKGFVSYFIQNRPVHAAEVSPWKAYVMEQVNRAVNSRSGHSTSVTPTLGESDMATFVRLLTSERWLLDEPFLGFQAEIIERATLKDHGDFITALLDLNPAILRRQPPPQSQAIEFAFTYVRTHLIPLITRIWPLPDDLPHAAGMGDLSRVKKWFDESGAPALGPVDRHYPCSPYMPKERVDEYARQWGPPGVQRVLDSAFAWSLLNSHLDVAEFLLAHGADINTTWSSHEPASILHELVFHANYESMQFLIDHGIDMTIRDHRWNATAEGWAMHAAKDEGTARWLSAAERRRAENQ